MSGGRGRGGGGKKQNISYMKPQEPSFLKKIKEQVGYKEPVTIDAKREDLPKFDEGDDDEKLELGEEGGGPQIVVLKPGRDLSQSDVAKILQDKEEDEDKRRIEEGRIVFKKPKKPETDGSTSDTQGKNPPVGDSRKRPGAGDLVSKSSSDGSRNKIPRTNEEEKTESRLLSFEDDEEEDD